MVTPQSVTVVYAGLSGVFDKTIPQICSGGTHNHQGMPFGHVLLNGPAPKGGCNPPSQRRLDQDPRVLHPASAWLQLLTPARQGHTPAGLSDTQLYNQPKKQNTCWFGIEFGIPSSFRCQNPLF